MKLDTLAQKLLFNTVRLETKARDGSPCGFGTGFVVSHMVPELGPYLFLVTNKHVIEGATSALVYFTRLRDGHPDIGNPFYVRIDDFELSFYGHPSPGVDVAIQPISWVFDLIGVDGVETYLHEVSTSVILRPEQLESLDAVEEILFVGYPNGIYDPTNYVPIIRRGTTATPVQLDYGGRPVFLIDASVFGGSSGSPVFRHIPTLDGRALARLELLGVVSEVFYRTEEGTLEVRPAPTHLEPVVHTKEMLDLGVVFKAHLILETIDAFLNHWSNDSARLAALRKLAIALHKRRREHPGAA